MLVCIQQLHICSFVRASVPIKCLRDEDGLCQASKLGSESETFLPTGSTTYLRACTRDRRCPPFPIQHDGLVIFVKIVALRVPARTCFRSFRVSIVCAVQLMSSEEAWRLSQARRSSPVDVAFAEDLVQELENHISRIPPDVRNS